MPRTLSPDPCNLKPRLARYHNSALSIWLSVDPMADKYPNKSSYSYCSNNPIKIIDPNGEDEWQLDKENGTFTRVGDKGGNTVDYYSVGEKDKDGIFQEESNYTINREGKCNRGLLFLLFSHQHLRPCEVR